MTLIAIAADDKRAEILTDTSSYTPGLRQLGRTSKVLTLPHLDAAVLTHGDAEFGHTIDYGVTTVASQVATFDALVEVAPELVRAGWEKLLEERRKETVKVATAFLVGYSPAAGEFQAYGFASTTDFTPWRIDGLFVFPSPFSLRPSDYELAMAEANGCHPDDLAFMRSRPAPQVPRDAEEWKALGLLAREHRAHDAPHDSGLKVFIGGDLHHTTLKRGWLTTRKVHSFNDAGQEFQAVVAGTLHPQGQAGPCPCGSGKRCIDCHLARHLDDPCLCKSGRPFRDCCSIDAEQVPAHVSGDPATA